MPENTIIWIIRCSRGKRFVKCHKAWNKYMFFGRHFRNSSSQLLLHLHFSHHHPLFVVTVGVFTNNRIANTTSIVIIHDWFFLLWSNIVYKPTPNTFFAKSVELLVESTPSWSALWSPQAVDFFCKANGTRCSALEENHNAIFVTHPDYNRQTINSRIIDSLFWVRQTEKNNIADTMTLPKELLAFDSVCTWAKLSNYKSIIKQPKCSLGKPSNFKILGFAKRKVVYLLAFATLCVLRLLGFAIAVPKKCIIGVQQQHHCIQWILLIQWKCHYCWTSTKKELKMWHQTWQRKPHSDWK